MRKYFIINDISDNISSNLNSNLLRFHCAHPNIHIECSKQFKWNSYFYVFGQSRPFWAVLKLLFFFKCEFLNAFHPIVIYTHNLVTPRILLSRNMHQKHSILPSQTFRHLVDISINWKLSAFNLFEYLIRTASILLSSHLFHIFLQF